MGSEADVAGRDRGDDQECWVAVGSRPFSDKLQAAGVQDPEVAVPDMQKDLERVLKVFTKGQPLPEVVSARGMKWGSAFKENVLSEGSLVDPENRMAACGDFCQESLAEGALLSARHLADQLLSS